MVDYTYLIEPDEMSIILWTLEGTYKRLEKDKTLIGKRHYNKCKKLHKKLWHEFMQK